MRRLAFIVAALVAVSCGPRPASCRTDGDCNAGFYCDRYFCVSQPETDPLPDLTDDTSELNKIADGGVDAGVESEPDAGVIACNAHSDCVSPLKCRGHVCR